MNNNNNAAAILFKIITTIAVLALIISVSRLFLGNADRAYSTGSYYFDYVLTNVPGMSAFIATILLSVVSLMGGVYASKRYEVIGVPLKYGGLLALILVTVLTYLTNKYEYHDYENLAVGTVSSTAASVVLTFVILVEWLALMYYAWKSEQVSVVNEAAPASTNSSTETTGTGQ